MLLTADPYVRPFEILLIALAIASWGVAFARQLKNRNLTNWSDPAYVTANVAFLGIIAFMFGLTELYRRAARAEVAAFCAHGVQSVAVDGQPLRSVDDFVAMLTSPQNPAAHHSHPTKRLRVQLASNEGVLDLELGRDSGEPNEYWLFYPRYSVTRDNELGRLLTDKLDAF